MIKKIKDGVLIIFGILTLSSCGTLSQISVDASGAAGRELAASDNLKEQVDSLALPLLAAKQTPGLVVGVLRADGKKITFGYGVTDHEHGYDINGDTLFAVGSVSKGFIAEVTAVLVHKGVLRWDDRLETLLPSTLPLSADARKITLLQLVTHTSGLPRQMLSVEILTSFIDYLFTGDNFYHSLDNVKMLDYLADFHKPAKVEPRYSNLGYALLDYILRLRTGKNVNQLLAENITRPLALTHTGYNQRLLPGYSRRAIGHAGRSAEIYPSWATGARLAFLRLYDGRRRPVHQRERPVDLCSGPYAAHRVSGAGYGAAGFVDRAFRPRQRSGGHRLDSRRCR